MSSPARIIHKGLAGGRWAEFSFDDQMGHVGSEVERAIRAHEQGLTERFDSALVRALELFDLTVADERWRGARRREVLRAREEFCRLFSSEDVPNRSAEELKEHFLEFGIAAREATMKNRETMTARDSTE